MSTETSPNGEATASEGPGRVSMSSPKDQGANANWAQFFQDHGWIDQDKIHCPDEFIFEMRFADGHSLVVYPSSGATENEMAPTIVHGVLTFKQGTDHFFYPWSMLASLVTKLNPRRTKKVQGREYAVDHGAETERRIRNSDDLVLQSAVPDGPKTVVGQTVHTPDGAVAGKRVFNAMDPDAPSWSAGGTDSND